jgi:hypothetical protein
MPEITLTWRRRSRSLSARRQPSPKQVARKPPPETASPMRGVIFVAGRRSRRRRRRRLCLVGRGGLEGVLRHPPDHACGRWVGGGVTEPLEGLLIVRRTTVAWT